MRPRALAARRRSFSFSRWKSFLRPKSSWRSRKWRTENDGSCRKRNIQFSATPFYLEAVAELFPFVDFYKIASYELLWHDLLRACARTGKPVVLSTGMATLDEIAGAVEVIRGAGGTELTLLHCTSGYPTPAAQCNLAAIATLRETFGCKVGWSDHSVDPGVIHRAVHRWNAEMVEFHLDLDGQGDEFKTGHCWLPDAIAPVIRDCASGAGADGAGKKEPVPAELADRDWRADPVDGLRPIKFKRRTLKGAA
jgi:sialic acid synthase SpsE